jgi:hypothetical protein
MRRVRLDGPVPITAEESRQAIIRAQLYLVRRSASLAARDARARARCRHLFRPENGTCVFCGSLHPGRFSP